MRNYEFVTCFKLLVYLYVYFKSKHEKYQIVFNSKANRILLYHRQKFLKQNLKVCNYKKEAGYIYRFQKSEIKTNRNF